MDYAKALTLDIMKLGSVSVRTEDIPTAGMLLLEIRKDLAQIRDTMAAEASKKEEPSA